MNEFVFEVPGISCGHCVSSITSWVGDVPGVTAVHVDIDTKTVRVSGTADRVAVLRDVDEAGYAVAA